MKVRMDYQGPESGHEDVPFGLATVSVGKNPVFVYLAILLFMTMCIFWVFFIVRESVEKTKPYTVVSSTELNNAEDLLENF
uniref:Uncharacterized protein n=1 Tax=Caenorhabditis japonica TaxID=281687 RepID=A0A8R1DLB0_CAEJA